VHYLAGFWDAVLRKWDIRVSVRNASLLVGSSTHHRHPLIQKKNPPTVFLWEIRMTNLPTIPHNTAPRALFQSLGIPFYGGTPTIVASGACIRETHRVEDSGERGCADAYEFGALSSNRAEGEEACTHGGDGSGCCFCHSRFFFAYYQQLVSFFIFK
jgi:hypothetical protein